nr:ATP-binding protein [Desulfogranum mediterraneum]
MRNRYKMIVEKRGGVFGNAVLAKAILDQLLHHSHVITTWGTVTG